MSIRACAPPYGRWSRANEQGNLDLIGGFRYADLKTSVNWDISGPIGAVTKTGGGSDSLHPWDGIIGIKGGIRLSDDGKWRMPYEADVGWGSHQWVWNGIIGIGYKFGWGDLSLAFRNLAYTGDSDQNLQKFRMTGPALAFTFTW